MEISKYIKVSIIYHLPKNHLMWFTLQKTYPKRAEDGLFFPKKKWVPNDFLRQHFTRPIAHPIQVPSNPSSLPDHISACDQHMSSFFQLIQGHATGAILVDDRKDMAPVLDHGCDIARKNREGEKC